MPLEVASYINGLVSTNPVSTDGLAQADDHLRLIKGTILSTFPNITGAVTSTHTEINKLTGFTGSASNLNYAASLDGQGVTPTEFSYLANVTSDIQSQLNTINTDLVNDTTPQLGGQLDTNGQSIAFGSWTIILDGTDLEFRYSNVAKFKISSAGAITAADDITAYGTP
jgi:hypothetical protein